MTPNERAVLRHVKNGGMVPPIPAAAYRDALAALVARELVAYREIRDGSRRVRCAVITEAGRAALAAEVSP
jgi:hypothetical protein